MSELLQPDDVRSLFPNRVPINDTELIAKARGLFDLVKNHQESHRITWYPDHVTTMALAGQYTLQLDVYYTGDVELSINTDVDHAQIGEERGKELMFKERILPLTGYNGTTEYWAATPGIGEIILFTYRPA